MAIKTRTRKFVSYLKSQFEERFEFFMEAQDESTDVVHVGDRMKYRNFVIVVDYVKNQVKMFGCVVCDSMEAVEAFLGKERPTFNRDTPSWAKQKVLKVKKQIEKLMRNKNSKERKVHPKNAGHITTFEFSF